MGTSAVRTVLAATLVSSLLGVGSPGSPAGAAPPPGSVASAELLPQVGVAPLVEVPLFNAIPPTRALDTRLGPNAAPLRGGAIRAVAVTGLGGSAGVPLTDVSAVSVNVTVVDPTTDGHVTVWPAGAPRPSTSLLNFAPRQTIANSAVIGVGVNGQIAFQVSNGEAHVVVDVLGWFAKDRGFVTTSPRRLLDTRAPGLLSLGPGETRELVVTGNDVAANAEAVSVNLTATGGAGGGHFRAWPAGAPVPTASALNFAPGQTVANAMILGIGVGGKIAVRNDSPAPTHLVVDLLGSFAAGTELTPTVPTRAVDTRSGLGGTGLSAGVVRTVKVTGVGTIPSSGVRAVVVNVTMTRPTATGHLTVWPAGGPPPTASILNVTRGVTVANAFVVGVDPQGRLSLVSSAGTADVIVDVLGWF